LNNTTNQNDENFTTGAMQNPTVLASQSNLLHVENLE